MIYSSLEQHNDTLARAQLADLLEEEGDLAGARFHRFMARYWLRPHFQPGGGWGPVSYCWKLRSDYPRALTGCLLGRKLFESLAVIHFHSVRSAEEALRVALERIDYDVCEEFKQFNER